MIDLRTFEHLVAREVDRIPIRYRRGVNGIFVLRQAMRDPGSLTGMYVLGHYHPNNGHLGATVTLYYGSFRRVFRGRPLKVIRREIAKTIAHELLHHWEFQAGRDELGEEDRRNLARWRRRLGVPGPSHTGRDLLEAVGFFLGLLLVIALLATLM